MHMKGIRSPCERFEGGFSTAEGGIIRRAHKGKGSST